MTCKELLSVTEMAIVGLGLFNPTLAAEAQVSSARFIAMCTLAQAALKGSTDAGDYIPSLQSLTAWAV